MLPLRRQEHIPYESLSWGLMTVVGSAFSTAGLLKHTCMPNGVSCQVPGALCWNNSPLLPLPSVPLGFSGVAKWLGKDVDMPLLAAASLPGTSSSTSSATAAGQNILTVVAPLHRITARCRSPGSRLPVKEDWHCSAATLMCVQASCSCTGIASRGLATSDHLPVTTAQTAAAAGPLAPAAATGRCFLHRRCPFPPPGSAPGAAGSRSAPAPGTPAETAGGGTRRTRSRRCRRTPRGASAAPESPTVGLPHRHPASRLHLVTRRLSAT